MPLASWNAGLRLLQSVRAGTIGRCHARLPLDGPGIKITTLGRFVVHGQERTPTQGTIGMGQQPFLDALVMKDVTAIGMGRPRDHAVQAFQAHEAVGSRIDRNARFERGILVIGLVRVFGIGAFHR